MFIHTGYITTHETAHTISLISPSKSSSSSDTCNSDPTCSVLHAHKSCFASGMEWDRPDLSPKFGTKKLSNLSPEILVEWIVSHATKEVVVLNKEQCYTLVVCLFPSHTLSSQTSSISWQMSASCVQEHPFSPRTLRVLPLFGTENLYKSKNDFNDSISSLHCFIQNWLWMCVLTVFKKMTIFMLLLLVSLSLYLIKCTEKKKSIML